MIPSAEQLLRMSLFVALFSTVNLSVITPILQNKLNQMPCDQVMQDGKKHEAECISHHLFRTCVERENLLY